MNWCSSSSYIIFLLCLALSLVHAISSLIRALRPDNHEEEFQGEQTFNAAEDMRQKQSGISKANTRVMLPRLLALHIEKSYITNELIECLELRKEKGFQLHNLVFRGCNFDVDRLSHTIGGSSWTWDRRTLMT